MTEQYNLEQMTASDLRRRATDAPALLLPLASIEPLGAHGPVGLDYSVAQYVAPRIAEKTGCVYAPTIPYGDTMEFCGLGGAVHVPPQVLEEYCYAVASSMLRATGAKAVVLLTFHSPNTAAANAVCRRLKREGFAAASADWWGAVGECAGDILSDRENGRGHGGEMITSVALAINAGAVRMERAASERPTERLFAVSRWNGTPFRLFGNFSEYCPGSSWGDTSAASAQKGQLLLQRGIEAVCDFIRIAFEQTE